MKTLDSVAVSDLKNFYANVYAPTAKKEESAEVKDDEDALAMSDAKL